MRRKHLAIVTSYPIPGEPVVRNRMAAYVNVLSGRGWDVTVVAAAARPLGSELTAEQISDWNMVYVSIGDYDRRNFIIRGLNELRHSYRLLRKAASLQPDVVLVTIPTIFLLLFSLWRFAPVHVVDIRDLVWEYLPKRPWWKGIARGLLKLGAIFALSRADVITFANPHQLDYARKWFASKRLLLVSNGIGRTQFSQISNLVHQSGTDGALRITYVGNVGIAQNLTTLVQAVARLDQLQVNIIGGGNDFDRLRMIVSEYGASNVHLHGSMPWEEAIEWYAKSDVVYAQLSEAFATAMPSKLYEYLATGLPVVYGGAGAATEILKSFSGVTLVDPNSPDQLKTVLLDIHARSNPARLVENIERIHRQYIREDYIEAIETVISHLNGRQ